MCGIDVASPAVLLSDRMRKNLEALIEMMNAVSNEMDVREVINQILHITHKTLPFERISFFMVNHASKKLEVICMCVCVCFTGAF